MKMLVKMLTLMAFLFITTQSFAQNIAEDSTGFAGDNFSLEGALSLFKKSNSIEEFEKFINAESSNVNNLDLNDDGEIDYIRVIDKVDGTSHAIILQAVLKDEEYADIAIVGIEKTGDESAVLQIIGDKDIYGKETIIEPQEESGVDNGKNAPFDYYEVNRIVVNVWFWSPVRFIYAPRYVPWVSPFRWRVYPMGWKPWRPVAWRTHYGFRQNHRVGFYSTKTLRVTKARNFYRPHRKNVVIVKNRRGGMRHNKVRGGGRRGRGR